MCVPNAWRSEDNIRESGLFPPCGFQEEFSHGAWGQVLYWLRHLTDLHSPPAMYIFKHFFVIKNYIAYIYFLAN